MIKILAPDYWYARKRSSTLWYTAHPYTEQETANAEGFECSGLHRVSNAELKIEIRRLKMELKTTKEEILARVDVAQNGLENVIETSNDDKGILLNNTVI